MSLSLNVTIIFHGGKFLHWLQVYKISMSLSSALTTDKFSAFTTDLRLAKILKTDLSKRALKYTHFELKSIVYVKQENKFPRLI